MGQPPERIETPRLLLRMPMASDAASVLAYAGDPEVVCYMDWPMSTCIDDALRSTERALQAWRSGSEFSWRIVVPPDDAPIGAVGCSVEGHRAEFGFVLARGHWGKGYATEVGRAILDWLTSLPHVHRVQATCDGDNRASARVLEKLGMSHEATLRRWIVRPNLPGRPVRDARLYAWVRD